MYACICILAPKVQVEKPQRPAEAPQHVPLQPPPKSDREQAPAAAKPRVLEAKPAGPAHDASLSHAKQPPTVKPSMPSFVSAASSSLASGEKEVAEKPSSRAPKASLFQDLSEIIDARARQGSETASGAKDVVVAILCADKQRKLFDDAPSHPASVPPYYPTQRPEVMDNAAIFERLDLDTLFFIFYYHQNTVAQYGCFHFCIDTWQPRS